MLSTIKLPASAEGLQPESVRPRLYLTTPQPSQVVVINTDKNEVGFRIDTDPLIVREFLRRQ